MNVFIYGTVRYNTHSADYLSVLEPSFPSPAKCPRSLLTGLSIPCFSCCYAVFLSVHAVDLESRWGLEMAHIGRARKEKIRTCAVQSQEADQT